MAKDDIYTPLKSDRYKTREQAEKNIPDGYDIIEDEKGFYGKRKTEATRLFAFCPFCNSCHFETTKDYDPEKTAHPGMISMIEPYRGYGWQQPPKDPSAGYGVLECCECGSPLAPEGKLKVKGGIYD